MIPSHSLPTASGQVSANAATMSAGPARRSRTNPSHRRRMVIGGLTALVAACILLCGLFAWHQASLASAKAACEASRSLRKWDDLKQSSDRWLSLDPTSVDAWLFRADAAEAQKDWDKYVECLSQVPASDARILPALFRKMVAEFGELNRPFDSLRTCDEALAIDQRMLVAHTHAIFFCAMTLQRKELLQRIRSAIRLGRESPEAYVFLANVSWSINESVYQHVSKWLTSDPDNEMLRVAQAMPVYTSEVKSDRKRSAEFQHIPPAEHLLNRYPNNVELIAYFLDAAIRDGDVARVEDLLNRPSAEQQQGDSRFLQGLAWLQETRGELELAEQSLKKALAIDPYWWQTHFQMHEILRRLNRPVEASESLEKYNVARELGISIRGLKRYEQSFDDPQFPHLLLKLAELTHDDEIASAIRLRLTNNSNPARS